MEQSDADDNNGWGDTSEGVCWETGCIDRGERGQQNSPLVGNKRGYKEGKLILSCFPTKKDEINVHKYLLQMNTKVQIICKRKLKFARIHEAKDWGSHVFVKKYDECSQKETALEIIKKVQVTLYIPISSSNWYPYK